MRLFALLVFVALFTTACGDRELDILGALDPNASTPSVCGVWRGVPGPGQLYDGWTKTLDSVAPATSPVVLELWTPGANQWGHPWNGYFGFSNGHRVNTPGVNCFLGGETLGEWSQSGNTFTFEGFGAGARYSGTAVVRDACEPGYAFGLYCSPNHPERPQLVMEGVVRDSYPGAFTDPSCPARYHFVARYYSPSSECR